MAGNLVVVALEIGSTVSGSAFSFRHEFEEDPLNVSTKVWHTKRQCYTLETSTALLVNPNKSFRSFGHKAEEDYEELKTDGHHENYFYFSNFMKHLQSNKVDNSTIIQDESGKSLPFIDILSMSIRYLKDEVMQQFEKKHSVVHDESFKFVITAPAFSNDVAYHVVWTAANEAGIDDMRLAIVSKTEAALSYIKHLPIDQIAENVKERNSGTRYVLINLHETATDLTTVHRYPDRSLKILSSTISTAFTEQSLNDAYGRFLAELFGKDSIRKLQEEDTWNYKETFLELQVKLRSTSIGSLEHVSLKIPAALNEILKMNKNYKCTSNAVLWHKLNGDKLRVRSKHLLDYVFYPKFQAIIDTAKTLVSESKFHEIDKVILVGKFAEWALVENTIRNALTRQRTVVPTNARYAIRAGAVIFGHDPYPSLTRYTYGVQHWPLFESNVHPIDKLAVVNGELRCKDVFFKYVTLGQHIKHGEMKAHLVRVLKPENGKLQFTVYISKKEAPLFIDEDGCTALESFTVNLDKGYRVPLEIEETLIFRKDGKLSVRVEIAGGVEYTHVFSHRWTFNSVLV